MVQSNENGNGNGNGQQAYKPEVEFEYLDSDVWIETDPEGNQDVAYTQDVLKALEEDDEEQSNGSSDSNGA